MYKNLIKLHHELIKIQQLIQSIEETLDWVASACGHLPEDQPGSVTEVALAFSEADLRKSYEYYKIRCDEIEQILTDILI